MASPVTSPPPSLLIAHGIAIVIMGFIIQGFLSFKDITEALGFYGVYHRDPINQLIHFFGVPAIICSLLVFFAHLNVPKLNFTITIPFVKKHRFNYATVVTLIYISCYLSLDLFGGVLYIPVAYMEYAIANNLAVGDQENARSAEKSKKASGKLDSLSWTGTGKVLRYALLMHFLGWYVQIHPGHGIFEGAKPAAMASLGGALTSAPLFAYYEGLWFIGVNKELQDRTKVLVDQYSIDLCTSGFDMKACADYDLN